LIRRQIVKKKDVAGVIGKPEVQRLVRTLIVQGGGASEDKSENIERLVRLVDKGCRKARYDFISFNEFAPTIHFTGSVNNKFFEYAEPVPGPTTDALSKKAKEYSCNMVIPIFERGKVRGEFYNSTVVIDRKGNLVKGTLQDGREVHCYRKVQIPFGDRGVDQKYYFRPGPGYVTFDTDVAKIGTLICHDRSYPESWRMMALMGAEIVFLGLNSWSTWRKALLLTEIIAMAYQNGLFIVVASRGGAEGETEGLQFAGKSAIVNPMGEILVEGPEAKGWELVPGEIDLRELDRYHGRYHFFRDRRPELYHLLTETVS
jgi:predicted amidohydrolase